MTNNKNVLNWIEEMKALVKPDKVFWIDGSEEQLKELRDLSISIGEMEELNEELDAAIEGEASDETNTD